MARLQDKVVLITGAARGIGAAMARAFVVEGAQVFVTDVRHELGRALVQELGSRATYLPLDVREEGHWDQALTQVLERHGRLDGLVNNAGITGFEEAAGSHDPEHASLEAWQAVHRTNLDGVFLGCKHGIRAMRATGWGVILNIASRSGVVGIPAAAAYASSKAAVRNHTRTVALYCAEQGLAIRCNAILPAAILTPMWDAVLGDGPDREARMREYTRDTPLQRFGRPEEVAALAVFLMSDEAPYITGTDFHIDGGMLAGTAVPPRPQ